MNSDDLRELAALRHDLRELHCFSEETCAALGLNAQLYQALLALKTESPAAPFTVSVLARQMLIKHNTAVGLVDRLEALGLALRRRCRTDRRSVIVGITPRGRRLLGRVAEAHRQELVRVAPVFLRHFRALSGPEPGAAP